MARVWGVPRVLTWWSVTRSGFRLGGLLVVAAARYGPLTGERNFVGMADVDATPQVSNVRWADSPTLHDVSATS